jgi:hypothetical protein
MAPPCPGCKVVLPAFAGPTRPYLGASPACWNVYSRMLGREYGDPPRFAVHRMTVATYAAQHPGIPGRRAIQSVNVHLVALYLTRDRKSEPGLISRVMGALISAWKGKLLRLPLPASLGPITVAGVEKAETAQEHVTAVGNWAQCVWLAWEKHHPAIIALADRTIARDEGDKGRRQ